MNTSRRTFLQSIGLSAPLLGSFTKTVRCNNQPKPNFLFILADDMGFTDLGCYGSLFHETPNIDRLREQGMQFTDAYAACPVCSPTRASIQSGQYPARVGVTDFITGHWRPYEQLTVPKNKTQYLPTEIITIAEQLKTSGYTSGMFGKWHLGFNDEHMPIHQGYDKQRVTSGPHYKFRTIPKDDVDPNLNQAEYLTNQCEQFIEQNQEKPFFAFLSHFSVHIPLQADQEIIKKYENKAKPKTGVNNPTYAAMVEHVDRSVGRILNQLDELNLTDNTVVIFFSDNGGLRQNFRKTTPIVSSNAPLRDEKGSLYEGGIRVPLIVRYPRIVKSGSECDTPVTSVDFYPTLLDITDTSAPNQVLDGKSLLPLLQQTGPQNREAIYWHYPHYHHSVPAGAIRKGNYKLIEFYDDNHLELYNLKDDIGESKNIAASQPALTKQLHLDLKNWRKSVNAAMPTPNPNFDPAKRDEWGKHPDRK